MSSNRTQRLATQVMSRHGSYVDAEAESPFILDVALWHACSPERSIVQQRAAFLHEQVRLAAVDIPPFWSLAGEHLPKAHRPFAFMTHSQWDREVAKQRYELTDAQLAEVRDCVQNWHRRGRFASGGNGFVGVGEMADDMTVGRGDWGAPCSEHVFWARGWMENHSIRDYAKVLRLGFSGIRSEVEVRLRAADIADPDYPLRENFWRAALSVCDAGILLGARYAGLAEERIAQETDPAERERLRHMADACGRVPAHGARTLQEAVQSLWLAHILTCGEDGINANSIGRLDQLLQPYYEADVSAGALEREQAVALMEELACKLYLDYDVQAIVLGGRDRAGECALNDMSWIILDATENLGFVRDLSVRLDRDTPPAFVERCAQLIARGGGIPFLFNDDSFIGALSARGIAVEDARDYAPIGCIELTIPGKANPHAVSAWMNSTKCLELALFGGEDPRTGRQLGPRSVPLTEMSSCEELFAGYAEQLEFFAKRLVYFCNRGELAQRERGPLPCWSVLTDDCIERGRDITDGGCVYNYHSICFLGTANTADSLMAIRKLVFDEACVSADELLAALRADFEGYEPLRNQLLVDAPKYGNDCAEVDELARRVADHFIDLMDTFRSPLDGRYFVHLFSFRCNLEFGKMVGATPDGRRADEPLAYSLSAHQGRDQEGVTAMLSSLSRLPHDQAAGATAAIIDLDPKLVAGAAGVKRLASLIQSALQMGVGQLQWNVMTAERLRQAQEDPEHYGNIPVRVAGYSQMFRLLNHELQEHVIARTKHGV